MKKKHYPIEEQINDCYEFLGIEKKNAEEMTEKELQECETELRKHFVWVKHPECHQLVPKHIATNTLIW